MNTVSRIENLRYILRTLLAEREEYAGWRIPDVLETQQTMMRALLNVRPPQPVSPEFLQAQDAELRHRLLLYIHRRVRFSAGTGGTDSGWNSDGLP